MPIPPFGPQTIKCKDLHFLTLKPDLPVMIPVSILLSLLNNLFLFSKP